ncbi:MAG: 4-hydroxyphenylacetate 3-hydroxylase family protein [Candidatus Heimdallarchaeota archaeon]
MTLKTPEEYLESIFRPVNLYMFGEHITEFWNHPFYNIIEPSINSIKRIYELAQIEEHKEVMTAISHLTGNQVNRFTHIHRSKEDLIKKIEAQRLMGQKTACCFQRCVGWDAINALYSVTYEMDEKDGSNYHQRLIDYWINVQNQDLMVGGAMTDPKGDRSRRPSQQSDPDAYLHVVKETEKGITVRGAKLHQTGFLNSHSAIVMPTLALREGENAYAVSFGVDTNADGIIMIYGRQTSDTRKMEDGNLDIGNWKYGGQEVFVIFDDVFIPHENVFMNGEVEYTGELINRFAGYHRQSYACKTGVGDVLIGSAALIAQYNGVEKASHVRDKLVEMIHLNETMWSCAVACSTMGFQRPAGNWEMDMLLANVNKQNVTRFPYMIGRYAEDLAGGIICTLPSENDLRSEEVGKLVKKYLQTCDEVSTEDRYKLLRFIESLSMGVASLNYKTESLHGAGSPQAQRIMIARQADFQKKIGLVKDILDIHE